MAALKIAQKFNTLVGSTSVKKALKTGYIRVTPVGAVGAGATVELGTNASVTTDQSLYISANDSVVLKERAVSSNFVGVVTGNSGTTFKFPDGQESPFAIGDTVEVTNATGFNTSVATVTGIFPIQYGTSGFESSQAGGVTIGVGSSDKTQGALTGNIRRVVKLDVIAVPTTKTHVVEVQHAGGI